MPRLFFFLVIFIALFLGIRQLLIPESFGQYGHYRGLSLEENELIEIKYAGKESCTECHEEIAEMLSYDVHSEISRESCHGPGHQHVLLPDSIELTRPEGREFCGVCHSTNAARSRNFVFQIDMKEHNTEKDCIECHNPHVPWEIEE